MAGVPVLQPPETPEAGSQPILLKTEVCNQGKRASSVGPEPWAAGRPASLQLGADLLRLRSWSVICSIRKPFSWRHVWGTPDLWHLFSSQPRTAPLPATHGFPATCVSRTPWSTQAPMDMRLWAGPLEGSPEASPCPALGTLRSLARSALSCTARPCSSGGRRMAVMAFSCRSRSLATLTSQARPGSWRPLQIRSI